jgi:hypothetical protein
MLTLELTFENFFWQVAFERRRMVADLLSQVEEERMALTAVHNGSLDTEEAQRSAARRYMHAIYNVYVYVYTYLYVCL